MKKLAAMVVTITIAMSGLVGVTTNPDRLPPWICNIIPVLCAKNA